MNQSEMKARAQALVNRINAMGFTKNGKPMVIDQAYELVAAQEGFRNQHVLRAAMSKADTSLAKSKEQEAQIAWENLIAHQAWTEQTRLELALSFLAENALFTNFLSYAQARALAEGEPDDEVSPELQEVLELMGYEVLTSDLGRPYWECSHPDSDFHGMCSEDFASEELAWADIWRHVQADVPGAGFAAQQAREGNTEPLERWMRCKRAEYAEYAKEDELLETKEPEESNPVSVDLSSYAAYSFSLGAMSLEALMAESSRWVGVTQINLEQPRSVLQAQMLEAFETWRRRCADEAFESFEFGAPVEDFSGWESNSDTNELSRIVFLQDKGEEADSSRYRFRVFLDENGVMECESFRID